MGRRLYLIAYDVSSPARWRRIFKTLKRRGAWQQLSAFACRLGKTAAADLERDLAAMIDPKTDRLMFVDLGPGREAEARIRRHGGAPPFPEPRMRIF